MKPRPLEQGLTHLNQTRNEKEESQEKEPILTFLLHKNAIKDWLLTFQKHVRDCDLLAAYEMFSLGVVGFGIKERRIKNIGGMADDWKKVWPKAPDFQFNFEELDFFHDEHMAHVAVTWRFCERRFGTKLRRNGRASLLLVGKDKQIKCAASHFSFDP
jgi:hypothetical protein